MTTTTTSNPIVDDLRDRLRDTLEARTKLVQRARRGGREQLTDAEGADFRKLSEDAALLEDRILEFDDDEKRATASASAFARAGINHSVARVGHEPATYDQSSEHSYFRDLVGFRAFGDGAAFTRLQRHAQESDVQIERGEYPRASEQRDLTRVDGAGGYFIPPMHLVDQYAALARPGRPTANAITNLPLPPGTDSLNVPIISTGTATAIQTADNAAVQETDLADTIVTAGVKTIAGQQDVAIQALEQSPVQFDEIIFADLIADYSVRVDVQVLSGSNASGQVKGIFGATGTNAVTYTDTTPTVPECYSKLASAINAVNTTRYLPPTVIVMTPSRWIWFLAALDVNNRPLVVPSAGNPMNAMGTFENVAAGGPVGQLFGIPVITDPSIPQTGGAGTNEDKIIVMRAADVMLWEAPIRTRVLPDIGSGNLTVRLQAYSYIAMTAERIPKAIAIISGTGLTTPVL